jgi:glycine hydroxymethyltransferase
MLERNRYTIDQIDPEIFAAIQKEDHIEMIASENYKSPAVMAAPADIDDVSRQSDCLC